VVIVVIVMVFFLCETIGSNTINGPWCVW